MYVTASKIKPQIKENRILAMVFGCLLMGITACSGGGNDSDQANGSSSGVNPGGGSDNNRPTLTITEPSDNSHFGSNQTITLAATASDSEDGDISGNIEWSSDLDGDLGVGESLAVNLSAGTHTITAYVEDSGNLAAESSVSLVIEVPDGVATVTWIAPLENTDNTPLTDLAGFKIYYGTSENQLDQTITIDDATVSSWNIEQLRLNETYYFAVTAYNSLGIESELSNLVSKYIDG